MGAEFTTKTLSASFSASSFARSSFAISSAVLLPIRSAKSESSPHTCSGIGLSEVSVPNNPLYKSANSYSPPTDAFVISPDS